jgi:acetoin:2,6-dichlorophenolindophenol oxidoreductase subunit beta
MIFSRALGDALREALERDPRVVVLGEDIADPYGGAFKVTKGLSTDFPERVRTTPISEAGITGVAAGLALSGYRPIVEIMFGDFLSLTFDQIVNHITKYPQMTDRQVTCPVIVRTPSGGGRGYGPTHSQSLEKHFLGVPDLRVVAASTLVPPSELLPALLAQDDPVLLVEHKLLYPRQFPEPVDDLVVTPVTGPSGTTTVRVSAVPPEDCTVTLVAYGYTAVLAVAAVRELAIEEELFAELVVPSQIDPLDLDPVVDSVRTTGSLVTLEEGTAGWSWGSGVVAEVQAAAFDALRGPARVLTSEAGVIPSARHLEDRMLLGASDIERVIREAA